MTPPLLTTQPRKTCDSCLLITHNQYLSNMRIILASPEAKVWSSRKHIPLGLGYLASSLREAGHDVFIYDAAIEDDTVTDYIDRAEAEGRPR